MCDVVTANHDDGHMRTNRQDPLNLGCQIAALSADDSSITQDNCAATGIGQPSGESCADSFIRNTGTETGRPRVAEYGQT
jgi:hypothetical protein